MGTKLTRKSFLSQTTIAALGSFMISKAKSNLTSSNSAPPPVCTLVPAETIGPFPSLPSGSSMYWRSDIRDAMTGVDLEFTIRVNGDNNCGVLQNYRVDVWHCNADGYYSHYATGGTNNGHSGANSPGSNNANLIYGRGSQVTDSNGEVSFITKFPGWYPGRTCHIHFAIYSGGIVGSSTGWTEHRISQFTFPITEKNALYTSNAPYSNYGADPLLPDNDNVFNAPAGQWALYQLGTLQGSGSGPYTSYYELAIDATGVVLPLVLLGFDGTAYGQGCMIRWKSASEINFSHYELLYSPDAEDFETIAVIDAKGNNSDATNDYFYIDEDRLLMGNAYYKLKMVDYDGTTQYSAPIAIKVNFDIPVKIHPNPAQDHLMLYHPLSNGDEKIMVLDKGGRALAIGQLSANTQYTRVELDIIPSGIYFLTYSNGINQQTIKFIKQ